MSNDDEKDVRTIHGAEGQPTDIPCHVCEEAYYNDGPDGRFCPLCYHAPENRPVFDDTDPWEVFWSQRKEELRQGNRGYCVGGFSRPYFESDGLY